ncbi:MAG: choice-of-anchor D domain-containing protein [Candidatus Dadabacteria bacterium]|nr:choice-of-anchor D domain-containing protein [Candidatus Dadabacteria bacterium]
MTESTPPGNIEAQIRGDISGQVAVGNYILQIGSVHGGVVNVSPPEKRSLPQTRTTPVLLRPRRFPGFLNRDIEVNSATLALNSALPVEFYGEAGLGKTTLLRYMAYHSLADSFRDGVVYLSAHHKPLGDLLQLLFDAFYESDIPFKPTDGQLRHALQTKQALILLDDVELKRDEVEGLMNAAPDSIFLLASLERSIWGEVRAISLKGLALDDALALVERELERPLTPEERPAAQALCTSLDGHPLRILQAVAGVREKRSSLVEVLQLIQSGSPNEALTKQVSSLPEPERRVLGAMAALGGVPVHAQHLTTITELPNVEPVLETLLRRHLVQAHGQRYSLTGILSKTTEQGLDLTSWKEKALAYFTIWAEQHRKEPKRIMEESDALMQMLDWAVKTGRWKDVIRMGWGVEGALVLFGRWGAWEQVLQWLLQVASALGDQASEAFALHQLGTRALCIEDGPQAHTYLTKSLELRESLGDRIGAEVTRHNLNLLPGTPPPSQDDSKTQEVYDQTSLYGDLTTITTKGIPLLFKWGVTFLSILLLGGLGIWYLWLRDKPPILSLSHISLAFSNQEIGTSSEEHAVTITNSGSVSLTILRATLIGVNSDDFDIKSDTCSNAIVNSSESCALAIIFIPKAPGKRSASLTITHTAGDSPKNVVLSGIGVSAALPIVALNPSSVDFGKQEVGKGSEAQTVNISNSGLAPLRIDNVSLTSDDEFTITADNCSNATIAQKNSCTIVIIFTPIAEGTRRASLTITDNASDSPQGVELKGIGTVSPPAVKISPGNLDFGIQEVNTISKALTVALSNKGSGSLSVHSVILIGNNVDDFTITDDNCSNATHMVTGKKCTVSIRFTPKAAGSRSSSLTIRHNAADSPRIVGLTGNGSVSLPTVSVNPTELHFGNQEVGIISKGEIVTLTNSGKALLKISKVVLAAGAEGVSFKTTDRCSNLTINPGKNCTITVNFTPKLEGSHSARLVVTHNASQGPLSVPLSGTGTQPPKPARILDFLARPQLVELGKETRLCYSAVNVSRARIDPGVGELEYVAKDCIPVLPKQTTTYTLTAIGIDGESVRRRVTVTVQEKGWCCSGGKVFPSYPEKCTGSYYYNEKEAYNRCQPPGWCCSGERVIETSSDKCKGLGGYYYYNEKEAYSRCQPTYGYCCIKGNLKKTDSKNCTNYGGKFYTDYDSAKRYCAASAPTGYCCIKGKISKMDSKTCANYKGVFYTNYDQAKKSCFYVE